MRVERYGGDLVVRLPDDLVEAPQLEAGDEVEVRAAGPSCIAIRRVSTDGRLVSLEVGPDTGASDASREP